MSLADVKDLAGSHPARDDLPRPATGPVPEPVTRLPAVPAVLHLAGIALGVLVLDWGTKAAAWRLLPGSAVINGDTSGAVPVLRGLVSHPLLGAVVDAGSLVLLVISGGWLLRSWSLGRMAWAGAALMWSGIVSNALDRWAGHLVLAPGSRRGVVDWISVGPGVALNVADLLIGIGLLLAITGVAITRIPRGARAAVTVAVLLLIPFSATTASGIAGNAPPVVQTAPGFEEHVRSTLFVGSLIDGHRVVWRDRERSVGWNLTVEATDRNGLVVAEWHLVSGSQVTALPLPVGTSRVYVRPDGTDRVMLLADDLA